jgi:hypothetical protein
MGGGEENLKQGGLQAARSAYLGLIISPGFSK